jgi:hypothetical protein
LGYEFQNVSDVDEYMRTIHLLMQRSSTIFGESHLLSRAFHLTLSEDSDDWYDWDDESESPEPPFYLQFIRAESRRGWSWCTEDMIHSCEINWFDSEPSRESSGYEAYIEELQRIEQNINFYRGYYRPPNEDRYRRLR